MRESTNGSAAAKKRASGQSRIIGSLRDALAAAGRAESASGTVDLNTVQPRRLPPPSDGPAEAARAQADTTRGAEREEISDALRKTTSGQVRRVVAEVEATTPTSQAAALPFDPGQPSAEKRTQLLRGKRNIARTGFVQDPVVGWLVVIGGPGLGSFRPVFEGNNAIGRSSSQRIPVDFGDESISSEEQAYIRYDSQDRTFLLVPNLAKTNIVSVDGRRPTGAVELKSMDVITMGRTQLVFVPFCGPDFDWGELDELKE